MTNSPGPWDTDIEKILTTWGYEHPGLMVLTLMAEAWQFGYTTGMGDAGRLASSLSADLRLDRLLADLRAAAARADQAGEPVGLRVAEVAFRFLAEQDAR